MCSMFAELFFVVTVGIFCHIVNMYIVMLQLSYISIIITIKFIMALFFH